MPRLVGGPNLPLEFALFVGRVFSSWDAEIGVPGGGARRRDLVDLLVELQIDAQAGCRLATPFEPATEKSGRDTGLAELAWPMSYSKELELRSSRMLDDPLSIEKGDALAVARVRREGCEIERIHGLRIIGIVRLDLLSQADLLVGWSWRDPVIAPLCL